MTSESSYGETHLGNVDVINGSGEVIAVGKLSASKFRADDGSERWQGHLTALAPASAAQDLDGEFALRFSDGSSHRAIVEQQQTTSQLSPGLDVSVVGTGEPPF